ncbi:glycosyltransferase family 9 protein [Streptosporangium lutulentum]|uniref:ADP-heptose:LPS heptosyltransferase n=1 Tax=Streptosporangium lutulentum TaxID=1461250 RepID=A0ABT9QGK7_9ACTN|nr:glycosyltransferase family 9 protein [Streptosporangium lutulentum]MDP9845433.1 ADP-heptose:LPS heptosyltransferase [Streptosporangium lutulentum]
MTGTTTGTVLVARLDDAGDVLLAGPAIRAVAEGAREVVLLVGPRGRAAGELLPGVSRVVEWRTPWIDPEPLPMTGPYALRLLRILRETAPEQALILTSFQQSPLPLALLLKLAGTPRTAAICADYAGSLLDLRHVVDETVDVPEAERMLGLAEAAGFDLPPGDTGTLAVRRPLPEVGYLTGPPGYVVVHPGVSAQARAWPVTSWARVVQDLVRAGRRVVVTGGRGERALTARVAGGAGQHGLSAGSAFTGQWMAGGPTLARGLTEDERTLTDGWVEGGAALTGGWEKNGSAGRSVTDLGGRTTFAELAAVLAGASAVVVANTGPAHLAAAVGTPVVSLFAPVVPAGRWAPYGVPTVVLGDQQAPCRGTQARVCPVPGHPCLSSVPSEQVVEAVTRLVFAKEDVK